MYCCGRHGSTILLMVVPDSYSVFGGVQHVVCVGLEVLQRCVIELLKYFYMSDSALPGA